MLVLGSGGRGESLLSADQDNALVHAGTEDDDPWFAALGSHLADLLDEAGVRRCQGGIMASNPEWRGTTTAWRERVAGWLRRSNPQDLLHVDIFYDMVPVAGTAELGRELHAAAIETARRAPAFIALLAESVAAMSPAVGLFGRLRANHGRVDLKIGGLLPLVGIARTLALRVGSRARSTPERIQDASAAGRVSSSDAETLVRIHESLLTSILEQQLEDLSAGVPPSGAHRGSAPLAFGSAGTRARNCACSRILSGCCVHRSPHSAAGRHGTGGSAPRAALYAIGMSGTHT